MIGRSPARDSVIAKLLVVKLPAIVVARTHSVKEICKIIASFDSLASTYKEKDHG